jgi:hypothetical protein
VRKSSSLPAQNLGILRSKNGKDYGVFIGGVSWKKVQKSERNRAEKSGSVRVRNELDQLEVGDDRGSHASEKKNKAKRGACVAFFFEITNILLSQQAASLKTFQSPSVPW